MSAVDQPGIVSGEQIKALETIRRGMAFSPELREGLGGTFLLAILATAGQIVVPIASSRPSTGASAARAVRTCGS